ncbi:hypothetical protein CDAR_166911 [Caerostris darwini]|uniref:C2H2-type domain-containing protein n=1 Tax=Caerostris darwini TaxID=1538125 RepID=A0AAV4UEJ3_9ARAC|nr:hypothetical protein CDAR_166911 [Caerostris darwini]
MTTSNMTVSSMAEELSQQTLVINKHVPVVENISAQELPTHFNDKDIIATGTLQSTVNEIDEYDQNNLIQTPSTILDNIHHLSDHSYIHNVKSLNLDSAVDQIVSKNLKLVDSSVVSNKIDKNLELQDFRIESDKSISNSCNNDLKPLILTDNSQILLNNHNLTFNSGSVDSNCNESIYVDETVGGSEALIISEDLVSSSNPSIQTDTVLSSSIASASNSYLTSLNLLTKKTNAPLGSVENPIQITHKGDSYETTQVLTQAQLQQISYVLQNQKTNKIQNGGKSVLYDPSTKTRIVCRVVHPSEVQGNNPRIESASKPNANRKSSNSSQAKRRHRKLTDDDDKGNSHLSKEEREEKKKQRPRTRSGRISKPPSYMVKDYKRIHHLDFDEDVYDSDGGYSDYHVSDEDAPKNDSKDEGLPPGVTTSKQRSFACQKCSKAYIGRGGLSRHYRLNPGHGSIPEGEEVSTQDENSSSSLASSALSLSGSNANSQTPTSSHLQATLRNETEKVTPNSISVRRKSRLKEALKGYSDEELIDVLLPRFAQKLPLWDFFVKKCEEKDGYRIYEMLKEFEKFLVEMTKISHTCLSPASYEDHGRTIINISSKQIAEALSLERGAYFLNDKPSCTLNKNLSSHSDLCNEGIQPHAKRKRMEQSVEDISTKLPEQILSDVHESGNLELPLPEVTFPGNSEFHRQDTHILNSTFINTSESQSDLTSKSLFDLNSSTTVTPSSLSSGCLSAVNSPKSQKTNVFLAATGVQQMHNLQVRKVQLLGTEGSQQVLVKNNAGMSINGFTFSPDFNLSEISPNKTTCVDNGQVEAGCGNLTKSTFQTLNLGTNIDILNQSLQEAISSGPSLSNLSGVNNTHIYNESQITDTQKGTKSIVSCLPLGDVQIPTTIVSDSEMQTCVLPDGTSSSGALEETRETEITPSEIVSDAAKTPEVLGHYVVHDGRIISFWSQMDNPEKSVSDQLVQNCLPGNLIIVQNPEGNLQVPNNQNLTLETLQTFVTVDPGQTSQTFTTVQM